MSHSSRPINQARTLSEEERAELVRLIVGGSWRVTGEPQGE